MIAIPTWLGVVSRVVKRGSFYLLPPIRFNMPVHVYAGGSTRIIRIDNRVLQLEDLYQIEPVYEWKWRIPESDWTTTEMISGDQYAQLAREYGEPEKRVFGAHLILRDGEMIWVDRKQYWKLQGYLIQVGVEI